MMLPATEFEEIVNSVITQYPEAAGSGRTSNGRRIVAYRAFLREPRSHISCRLHRERSRGRRGKMTPQGEAAAPSDLPRAPNVTAKFPASMSRL